MALATATGCRVGAQPNAPLAAAPITANATVPPDGVYHCTEVSSIFAPWTCLGALPADLARRRSESVRVTIRGGRRVSQELVNGRGAPLLEEESRRLFTYDADGHLAQETTFDGFGVERFRYIYAPDGSRAERRNAWGEPACGAEEDQTWLVSRYDRDARGRLVRTRYQDAQGGPRTNGPGIYEMRRTGYGESSFAGDVSRFDANGRPAENEHGVHRALIRYSDWGETSVRFFGTDGAPARAHDRFGYDNQLDVVGNVLRSDSLDAQGNIVNIEGFGGRVVHVFDEHGDAIEDRRFGPDGSPYQGGSAALVRRLFDKRGLPVLYAYFDAAGQPHRRGNFARKELVRDAAGAVIEERLFRADGRPGHHGQGDKLAVVGHIYDDRHNLLEIRNYAADGSAGRDANGTSVTRRRYHHDKLVELAYFGVANEPHEIQGVARIQYQRDATGLLLGRIFENAKGEVVKGYDYHAHWAGYATSPSRTKAVRTKEEALQRANDLLAAYTKSGSFFQAGAAFGDEPNAQVQAEHAASVMWPTVVEALDKLPAGGVTPVVETPAGFFVVKKVR